MHQSLENLFEAADNHAQDAGEPDHAVGDLQDLLRAAWEVMRPSQRRQLLNSDAVEQLIEAGAREEFDLEDLVEELENDVKAMELAVAAAGYTIREDAQGYYWTHETDESHFHFENRDDAVDDAHAASTSK